MTTPIPNKNLLDKLLTANGNGKGWKKDLFLTTLDDEYICNRCENVCMKAVQMDCKNENEHKSEEIHLFCQSCLKQLISFHQNQCPITNHANPKFVANRNARLFIRRAKVLCPNSVKYQLKKINRNNNNNNNNTEIDTETVDSESQSDSHMSGCKFEGSLSNLIEEHIQGCIQNQLSFDLHDTMGKLDVMDANNVNDEGNHNPNDMTSIVSETRNKLQSLMIEHLQEKNEKLEEEVHTMKIEMVSSAQAIQFLQKSVLENKKKTMELEQRLQLLEQ